MIFGRTLRLLSYFMCANSEGSDETERIRRLASAFAGRLCDKYHNLMSWLKCCVKFLLRFRQKVSNLVVKFKPDNKL